ncbi:Rv1733c family protein [Kribbella sp. CA-247076]|uniref:Rv1733c family protein n=1 Tax=Kribbella sp. CA-247076 TaxID=3239941 RepID=UPI003D9212E3
MSTTHPRRAELSVLMYLRRLGFGRNPLRRRVDRLESALLVSALVAALLVVPAAVVLGTTITARAEEKADRHRALLQSVPARTLESTAEAVPSSPGQVTSTVRIGWLDPSGVAREGTADVVIGTEAGAELTVWLDASGALTRAPREPADSAALGTSAGMTLPMLAWPLLWATFRLARRPLDRRRAEDWAREWERVSVRWTRP